MGLGPWYGLWPTNIGQAEPAAKPHPNCTGHGEAKPRRTSGGEAKSNDFEQSLAMKHVRTNSPAALSRRVRFVLLVNIR
jgi:hypothetical protein